MNLDALRAAAAKKLAPEDMRLNSEYNNRLRLQNEHLKRLVWNLKRENHRLLKVMAALAK